MHFFIYGLVLLALALTLINIVNFMARRSDHENWIVRMNKYNDTGIFDFPVILIAIFVAVWLSTPLVYEFATSESVPVTFDEDGIPKTHPYGTFTVGKKYSNLPTIEIHSRYSKLPSVSMLTENPKVRTLEHWIWLSVTNLQVFYSADQSRVAMRHITTSKVNFGVSTPENSIEEQVVLILERSIYDLNNAHSKDLAQFFNPLDTAQQKSYRALMEQYLNTILAKDGIAVSRAQFSIK